MEFRKYEFGDIFSVQDVKRFGIYIQDKDVDFEMTWTAIIGHNQIIGCAGFKKLWNGVYECWVYPKSYELFYQYRFGVIKKMRKEINNMFVNGAHRIQATSMAKEHKSCNLIKFLGFIYEATLSKYGPNGDDFIMYALIK